MGAAQKARLIFVCCLGCVQREEACTWPGVVSRATSVNGWHPGFIWDSLRTRTAIAVFQSDYGGLQRLPQRGVATGT